MVIFVDLIYLSVVARVIGSFDSNMKYRDGKIATSRLELGVGVE